MQVDSDGQIQDVDDRAHADLPIQAATGPSIAFDLADGVANQKFDSEWHCQFLELSFVCIFLCCKSNIQVCLQPEPKTELPGA